MQQALSIPTVPSLLLTIFICVFSFAGFETTISMLVSGRSKIVPEFAFDDQQVFLVFAYIGFVLALVQGGLVRRLAGKVADTSLAGAGAIIELAGFGLMIVAIQQASVTVLLIALGIVTGGFAFVTPSLNGLLSRRTSADRQGGVLGIGQSVSSLARILGAMLGPTLLARQAYLPFIIALVLMVIGLLLIIQQSRVGRDAVPDAQAE